MARLTKLAIQNYRSIGDQIQIEFPANAPVVLVGENNAGKSNIVKALSLLLGPIWPANYSPEDHEFFARDRDQEIKIFAEFAEDNQFGGRYRKVTWTHNAEETEYVGWPLPYIGASGWINNTDRDTCVCIMLEAERNLRYQLSYTSKSTLLSKLMHRFHNRLMEVQETREDLEQLFAQIKTKFAEIPEFSEFTGRLKEQLGDFIGTMTHRLEVDFEAYNPTNFFHALRLHAQEGGTPRTLEELGTGEEQILAVSFAYAYAQAFHGGIVLVVEEPEAHLHPLAQQWLARRLTSMCAGGLQVLLTSHSPHFIDVEGLEGLCIISKSDGRTISTQLTRQELTTRCLESGALGATPENILPFYKAGATAHILEGFFAKAVVLVEGPTESLALPIYLARCGLDNTREGVAFIAVGGKGALARWRRLFAAFEIPVFVVFDNDAGDDQQGIKRRDALNSVGVPADQVDGVIASDDVIVTANFAVFGTNFESALRARFAEYEPLEQDAVDDGVSSKPFRARWVAQRLAYSAEDARWDLFRDLAENLKNLLE